MTGLADDSMQPNYDVLVKCVVDLAILNCCKIPMIRNAASTAFYASSQNVSRNT
jgi:hypothetical protein